MHITYKSMSFEVSLKRKLIKVLLIQYIFYFSTAVENYRVLISPGVGMLLMLAWSMWSTTALKWLI